MNRVNTNQPIRYIWLLAFVSLAIMNYNAKGYLFAFVALLYIWRYHKTFIRIDNKLMSLLLFGFTYVMFYYINYDIVEPSIIIYFLGVFPIFYLSGKGLANNTPYNIDKIIFIVSLSIAIIPIISILSDINKNGFLVIDRNIPIIGWGEEPISATSIASMIIVLCSYSTYLFSSVDKWKKYIYTACGFLGFYCALRLQSRTSIVCISLLFIVNIYLNRKYILKHKFLFFIIFFLLFAGISYIITNYSDQLAIIERFQEDDVATANGRTELHSSTLIKILESPLGGNRHLTFAHNLFLDCARVSGLVPFVLLIVFVFKHYYSIYKLLKKKNVPGILKYNIAIISLLLLVYLNTEPILEGVAMLFAYFCFIAGITSKVETQFRKHSYINKE